MEIILSNHAQSVRRGRKGSYFTYMWKRGWLSPKDADELRKYIGLLYN